MIDREWLSNWVQPQHLEQERMRSYRDAFASHPARVVAIPNFLTGDVAAPVSRFMTDEAEYRIQYKLYSSEAYTVSEAAWLAAPDSDRFQKHGIYKRVNERFRRSPNRAAYLRFRRAFNRRQFADFFEAVSGLPLGRSDLTHVHSIRRGDMLRAHNDNVFGRQLAIVLYLSPGWEPGFGGALHVIPPDRVAATIEPEFNTLALFDITAKTQHYVERVSHRAGDRARVCIGGWIYSREVAHEAQ